eukprot:gene21230-biopygen8627
MGPQPHTYGRGRGRSGLSPQTPQRARATGNRRPRRRYPPDPPRGE